MPNDFPESGSERWANILTHGLGVVLSVASTVVMLLRSQSQMAVVAVSVFGATLVLLYSASTIYHSMKTQRMRDVFNIVDHSCIYLLIAGTYTPLTMVALRGGWGWSLFGVVWGLALIGVLWKVFDRRQKGHWLSTALYLLMGWMMLIALKPIIDSLSGGALLWLVLGGASYSLGVIFFAWKSLRYSHAIWHLFVLGGSVCHVVSVMLMLG